MADLHDKIETALNEARILILGGQVIVGAQFRIFFEGDFQQVALSYQRTLFVGLATLLLGLALLMAPASYHNIVEDHRDTAHLYRFTTAMLSLGLLPFAISLGTTMLVTVNKLSGPRAAMTAAVIACLLCIVLWYGYPLRARRRRDRRLDISHLLFPIGEVSMEKAPEKEPSDKLSREVKEVLLEARMVLPGAQALLGFQFINIWLEGFDIISQNLKLAHLASLCAVAVSTILLMMPAAYHRLATAGEDTEELVRFAGRTLLIAMVFLAIGVCGDFFVIARKLKLSLAVSIAMSVAMLAVFLGLWFGYTLWKRAHKRRG